MTRRDATELMLKVVGLFAWARALDYGFAFFPFGLSVFRGSIVKGLLFSLSPLALVGIGVVLVWCARPLAGRLVEPATEFEHAGHGRIAMVLQGLGLYLVIVGAPTFSNAVSIWQAGQMWTHDPAYKNLVLMNVGRAALVFGVGLFIFLFSHGIAPLLTRKTPPVDTTDEPLPFLLWQQLILGAIGIYLCLTAGLQVLEYGVGVLIDNQVARSLNENAGVELRHPVRIFGRFLIGMVLILSPGGVQRLWNRARKSGYRKHPPAEDPAVDEAADGAP